MTETAPLSHLRCSSDADHALRTYQKWIRKVFPLLIFGDRATWDRYHLCRDCLLGRFPQLRTRLAPPMASHTATLQENRNPETLSNKRGIALSPLDPPDQEGSRKSSRGRLPQSFPEGRRRGYWAAFFKKEMGIDPAGHEALVSLLDFVRNKVYPPEDGAASSIPRASRSRREDQGSPPRVQRTVIEDMLHDIGTPLHIIGGRATLLKRKLLGSEIAEKNLSIIEGQVEKVMKLLQVYSAQAESLYSEMHGRGDQRQ